MEQVSGDECGEEEVFEAFKFGPGSYVQPYHDQRQVDVALSAPQILPKYPHTLGSSSQIIPF